MQVEFCIWKITSGETQLWMSVSEKGCGESFSRIAIAG